MWGVAYLTFYIEIEDFSTRFMGAVTALLVLGSMTDSLNQRLPPSGDVKLIDVWNIWFVLQIILIGLVHVVINCNKNNVTAVGSQKNTGFRNLLKPTKLNTLSRVCFPALNPLFILGYIGIKGLAQEQFTIKQW